MAEMMNYTNAVVWQKTILLEIPTSDGSVPLFRYSEKSVILQLHKRMFRLLISKEG